MRIDRMLAITILLLSRDRVSAKELANRFEVSVRTIYRDMDAINIAGIPIISYPGSEGGFGIMDGFKLDRQIFTIQDMVSILSPLEGINRSFRSEAITKVIDKIHSLIPSNEKREVKNSLNKLLIDVNPWGINNSWKEMFQLIQRAIDNQKIISFSYTTGERVNSVREVEPMTLLFKSYSWYLWGYCLKRDDYRLFKLRRINDLRVNNKSFIRRAEVYEAPKEFSGEMIDIKLRANREFMPQAIEYFERESVTDNNDHIIIDLKYPMGAEWIKEYIFSFGSKIQVIEPKWLRDEVVRESKKILENYSILT